MAALVIRFNLAHPRLIGLRQIVLSRVRLPRTQVEDARGDTPAHMVFALEEGVHRHCIQDEHKCARMEKSRGEGYSRN